MAVIWSLPSKITIYTHDYSSEETRVILEAASPRWYNMDLILQLPFFHNLLMAKSCADIILKFCKSCILTFNTKFESQKVISFNCGFIFLAKKRFFSEVKLVIKRYTSTTSVHRWNDETSLILAWDIGCMSSLCYCGGFICS